MNVLSGTFDEAHFLDGIEKSRRCPVVKGLRWHLRLISQVNVNAVALNCPDACAVIGELKALLIILTYNPNEVMAGDLLTA
jgi:hypothetical protein